MKGDLNPAALRLSATLPSRTHYRTRQYIGAPIATRKRRELHINGVLYSSVNEAAKRLGMANRTLYKMMYAGLIKDGEKNVISRPPRGRRPR